MGRPYTTRTYWYYDTPDECPAIRTRYEAALQPLTAEGVTWEWWHVPAMPSVYWLRPHLILVVHWQLVSAGFEPLTAICGVHLLSAGALAGILGPGRRFTSEVQLGRVCGGRTARNLIRRHGATSP